MDCNEIKFYVQGNKKKLTRCFKSRAAKDKVRESVTNLEHIAECWRIYCNTYRDDNEKLCETLGNKEPPILSIKNSTGLSINKDSTKIIVIHRPDLLPKANLLSYLIYLQWTVDCFIYLGPIVEKGSDNAEEQSLQRCCIGVV